MKHKHIDYSLVPEEVGMVAQVHHFARQLGSGVASARAVANSTPTRHCPDTKDINKGYIGYQCSQQLEI